MPDTTRCRECGSKIPAGRRAALPGVETCLAHSDAVAITEDDGGVVEGADRDDILASVRTAEREKN